MNQETYTQSASLLQDLGFDYSSESILDKMSLPPLEDWVNDKKLAPFVAVRSMLPPQGIALLERAIKNSRSAAKGSINGKLLEDAVEELAKRHGCTVERNVRINNVAAESIDCVITFIDGSKEYFMCQMDLWNGGQQGNRAEKYLNRNDGIFICVVYNEYTPPSQSSGRNEKSQVLYQWIKKSYETRRLMWLADLDNYIRERNAKRS